MKREEARIVHISTQQQVRARIEWLSSRCRVGPRGCVLQLPQASQLLAAQLLQGPCSGATQEGGYGPLLGLAIGSQSPRQPTSAESEGRAQQVSTCARQATTSL